MKRMLSGIKPTGRVTLGNYIGIYESAKSKYQKAICGSSPISF